MNYTTSFQSYITVHTQDETTFVENNHVPQYLKQMSAKLKGTWKEQKLKLKKQFIVLTDNDLLFAKGRKEEMMLKLEKILGISKKELDEILDTL